MKKLLSVLLSLLVLVSFFSCNNETSTKKEEEVSNTIEIEADLVIRSASDFIAFAEAVNSGDTFENKTVALINDITLSAEEWIPVGATWRKGIDYDTLLFEGTFDGYDNTITYEVKEDVGYLSAESIANRDETCWKEGTEEKEEFLGLFARVGNATIKNLNVNVTANLDIENTRYGAFGGVVGYSTGDVVLENITVNGSITVYDCGAGILARSYGKQKTPWTENDLTDEDTVILSLNNCTNNASIKSYPQVRKAGGLIGFLAVKSVATVDNCVNTGNIEAYYASYCAGGVSSSKLIYGNITNSGEITSGKTNHDLAADVQLGSGSNPPEALVIALYPTEE